MIFSDDKILDANAKVLIHRTLKQTDVIVAFVFNDRKVRTKRNGVCRLDGEVPNAVLLSDGIAFTHSYRNQLRNLFTDRLRVKGDLIMLIRL